MVPYQKLNFLMTEIIPSMLVTEEVDFEEQLVAIQGVVKMVQIDLADGEFVPNITWAFENPETAQGYLEMDFELHLMVADPVEVMKSWDENSYLKRILFHYESVPEVRETIKELKKYGKEIGIVLNPETDIDVLDEYLNDIQSVMFMGVNPGFQGQPFIVETLDRVREFKAKNTKHFIEVDGAVSEANLAELVEAGVNAVCPGSAIFGNEKTPVENVEKFEKLIHELTA